MPNSTNSSAVDQIDAKLRVRRVAIAALALTILSSSHAFADWQGTTWGMTMSEADHSFRVPHHTTTPADYDKGWFDYKQELSFDYAVDDLEFRGALLFRRQPGPRLSAIFLGLKDKTQCSRLEETLRRIYGRPAKEDMNEGPHKDESYFRHHYITWYDEKNHNEIELRDLRWGFGMAPDCEVLYSPFIVPPPGTL